MKIFKKDSISKNIYMFISTTVVSFALLFAVSAFLMVVINMIGIVMRAEHKTVIEYTDGISAFREYLLKQTDDASVQADDTAVLTYNDFVTHLNSSIAGTMAITDLVKATKSTSSDDIAGRVSKNFERTSYNQAKAMAIVASLLPQSQLRRQLGETSSAYLDNMKKLLILAEEYHKSDKFDMSQFWMTSQIFNLDKKNKELFAEYTSKIGAYSSWIVSFSLWIFIILAGILIGINTFIGIKIVRSITSPLKILTGSAKIIAAGDFSQQEIAVKSHDEIGTLTLAFNNMTRALKENKLNEQKQNWLKTGKAELGERIRGEQDLAVLAQKIIEYLCIRLDAKIGVLYVVRNKKMLQLTGGYAYKKRNDIPDKFEFGEGLVGQAARQKESIIINNVPKDYIKINSGLGESSPHNIMLTPFFYEEELKGVIEIASFQEFTDIQKDFLDEAGKGVAISIYACESYIRTRILLEETQAQAGALRVQQEELQQTNQELEEQTLALGESEERLKNQKNDLQQMNTELEENALLLEMQKENVRIKNVELEEAKRLIEQKARDLELASKYKSDFLTNMSHELRTPLNSILILSRLLSENKKGNLDQKNIEFAQTINGAGADLLKLINEALDLAKVEAGKMDCIFEEMEIADLSDTLKRYFMAIAEERGLIFTINRKDGVPSGFVSDRQKVEQIVKNLLSNSFKFTERGAITLDIFRPDNTADLSLSGIADQKIIAFSVSDTGIGIPEDKKQSIFEAFQQADGTTSRKYGGTGLGLTISRKMAKLLGGEIALESTEGKGTVFTLYLPETPPVQEIKDEPKESRGVAFATRSAEVGPVGKADRTISHHKTEPMQTELESIKDDRKIITPGDKSILIIEDDSKFAEVLLDLARERGFKGLIAGSGETGLHFADYYKPSAIILDIGLPGMDGLSLLERLKDNAATRHIPVHFISASDDKSHVALKMGAIGYLTKPVSLEDIDSAFQKIENLITKKVGRLLVVEDNETERNNIVELLDGKDVQIETVSTGDEAYELLRTGTFDCVILDLDLEDLSGPNLIKKIKSDNSIEKIPVIIYTGKEFSREDETALQRQAGTIIIKGAKSYERLLDETTLFLHRVEKDLPEQKQKMIRIAHDKESVFKNKKVLIVDDDMRNVFAVSNIIEEKGMEVLVGKNGREGIERLNDNPDIDLVLMDIMMPEMNGYEAMTEIRKQMKFKSLPIIALTAKAMTGERNKCLEAGASDYLAKPFDIDKLLSLMRVWLYHN
ncbi:MAG: response regulator [Proteobacteria bacterium]|nr:response regulator [Pseudomonadota bacterium]MBU4036913.1 response regulator [Pseudomonadota bacterium]